MYAVVNHLHLDKPVEDFVQSLRDEGVPILAGLQGFKGFYLIKEGEGRGVVIILWETQEDAVNGAKVFGPTWFAQNLAPHLAGEQVRTIGQVLVHG